MQLSEGGATGETGNDSDGDGIAFIPEQTDGLPPVFASEAVLSVATGIEDKQIGTPETFALSQNYPNPFNPSTIISFALPQQSNVKLNVYNIIGEVVAELANANLAAGFHQINFDASNLSSGLYFYRISAGNFVDVKKMMLLK